MRIKRTSFLISMVVILVALLAWIVPNSRIAQAATATDNTQPESSIVVSGLGAKDAIIHDPSGNLISSSDPLYTWNNYNVSYNWSIADGVPIKDGDTAIFELPGSVAPTADLNNIPMYNEDNVQIGTFSIKAGSKTGTITFNDVLSSTTIDRTGHLQFHVNGTSTDSDNPGYLDWNINKVGWLYDYDENGLPKYVVWNIAFNPRSENLSNVVVTDKLGPNQTYVEGSAYAPTGGYNNTGNFIPNGGVLNPTVTQNGNVIQFHFGNVSSAVDLTFRVLINVDPAKDNIWENNASLTSDQLSGDVSSNVQYGGSGSGSGTNALGNVLLQKISPTGQGLAGAVYELKDSKGNVLISEATVDENGQLAIHDIPVGSYTLTEVKAPDGYELNTTPINFTIAGTTNNETVNLSQEDIPKTTTVPPEEPDTGNVVLNKKSADLTKVLPGAEFELLDSSGNVIQSNLVTNSEGRIVVNDLKAGDYAFRETKAPDGYQLSTELIPFTVTKDQTVEVQQDDNPIEVEEDFGGAKLIKTDTNGKPLAGAIYELKNSDGAVVGNDYTTDSKGQIIIDELPDGKYTLTEIKAPNGYDVNKTPIEFTVEKGKVAELSAEDKKTPTVTEPSEPSEPVVPGEPEEPGEPSEPVIPGEPEEPGEPSEPVVPGEPEEPGEPSEPVVPGEPEEPSEPSKPVIPGEPSEPSKPVVPGEVEKPSTSYPDNITSGQSGDKDYSGIYMNKGSKKFPQTGDQQNTLITLIGFIILIGITGFEINHKHA